MISLQKLIKEPRSIVDFYKIAFDNPKDFANNLKLDEDLKHPIIIGVFVFMVAAFTQKIGSSFTVLLMTILFSVFSIFLGALFTLVIAKIADAKINYQECLSLDAYLMLLCLPVTFFNSMLMKLPVLNNFSIIFSLVSSAIYIYFSFLVLAEVRGGNRNIIIVCAGLSSLIMLTPYLF